jgi:hypothetical protein
MKVAVVTPTIEQPVNDSLYYWSDETLNWELKNDPSNR